MNFVLLFFIFLIIFYLIFSYTVGDFSYLKNFIVKYTVESILLFFASGKGLLTVLKVIVIAFSSRVFQFLVYHFEKDNLRLHPVFQTLESSKRKDRVYNFENINTVSHALYTINLEIKMCIRLLKTSLEFFEKTYANKFYKDTDVTDFFSKEIQAERNIVYDKFLKHLVSHSVNNPEVIKNFYKNEMETALQPIYKKLLLLKDNKYSFYRCIDLILNQFWIVYLSIDLEIIKIFSKMEKDIEYKENTHNDLLSIIPVQNSI